MKDFKDKVVAITGAGSGIGRALAIEFSKLGSRLALNDNNVDGLNETLTLLGKEIGDSLYSEVFDVSDSNAMEVFAGNVNKELGPAHIIINNAGIAGYTEPAYSTPMSAYRKVMDVNFFGVVNGTRTFLPQLVENNEGAVVNISSVFGLIGYPNSTDYCASKFAVRGFTESLAVELLKSPISVHCVHPGGIKTNITSSALNDETDKEFDEAFLVTPPEKLAVRIIRGIKRGEPRIVYGYQSGQIRRTSALPKRIFNRLLWNKVRGMIKEDKYLPFIKDL